ncbi:RNAPII degradation factor [Podila minutissima]|uniref:RNA polymerase II degradation factor 1 n=1 Tax=Podila minutissima TaxID=64525 RepID=A0A9P5VLW7_9FUNG|nr:RNAPII degradation factor [Podila minutissima]
MASHSNSSFSQKSRSSGKDEPEDLRQLRQAHGGSLATLKELFADWTEEDLLYAIQESGGDLELTILRISDGHATQWGEVKGKKKTPKPKSTSEKQEFRSNSRGGFAARGRGDGTRGGRGGATRGAPRAQNGGERARPVKSEQETVVTSEATVASVEEPSTETPAWATSAESTNESTSGWGDATSSNDTTTTTTTITETTTADSWGTTSAAPVRKVNTATIPAGSKMSWAKIVNPCPRCCCPRSCISVPVPAPVHIPAEPEVKPEPIIETVPVVEEVVEAVAEPEPEPVVEEKVEEPVAIEATPEPEVAEPEVAQDSSPKNITPVGPPGLKKSATQSRRLNQDAAVVMPSGLSALQSVGVKFGSFSLNDETEAVESEAPAPAQSAQVEQPQAATATAPAPAAAAPAPAAAAPAPATASAPAPAQPTYGRQPSAPASGYQGTPANAGTGLSPAVSNANASYLKQDPAANYLGQHHHHPGMGHEAMGSPYGSYMPNPASQLGSFGMGPMASLPNEYAALYGNDIQRAMYYDPASYGQIPVTAANNYQSRDGKYNQETSTASTSGAATTGSTQAHQTLQQQQQQQQAYPNIAGGMPYYPYYYMPNQFPNAYQQSGYGQPFVNKNMYPMYQHQHNANKPGAANNTPYGNYSTTAGQGHHQYSQSGYEDMSGAGIHGMGGLNNDPYGKYGNPSMQNFLGNQQQPATPTSGANNAKANSGSNYSSSADKTATTGSQSNASQMAGGASLQGQPGAIQGQQGYYQQQMFSNYQYQGHHQGYHPNHQGQHQGSRNQQFWGSQN